MESSKQPTRVYLTGQSEKRQEKRKWQQISAAKSKGSLALTAAGLAQSAERLTAEREVAGSIPGAGPILRVLKQERMI